MLDEVAGQADAEVAHRIRQSFGRQGLMKLLDARLTLIEPGHVQISMPSRPEVSQQHGYIHAGATSAIADTAGGYAGLTLMPRTSEVLTIEYKLNLLAPATGDRLEAEGTVLRSGRTLTVCRLEVFAIQDAERRLIATGQQTLISVPGTAES